MAKEYTVIVKRYKNSFSSEYRETEYTGTMEYLVNDVFGYTLECGHSWDSKINDSPKTGKSLVKALNESANACRDYRTTYSLK